LWEACSWQPWAYGSLRENSMLWRGRYGAEYPFEVVLTTAFTGLFRNLSERVVAQLALSSACDAEALRPLMHFGEYGPREGDFRCRWYAWQLVQAVLLIGLPARLLSVGLILSSLRLLPAAASPVYLIARAWYTSRFSCRERTAAILYVVPLCGDALQFIIVDKLQAARAWRISGSGDEERLAPLSNDSDSESKLCCVGISS